MLDPSDPAGLEPGDVLVAPITDPSWTPLFVPAAAVVVDVGAQVSHAVIVSRELGIPCVVSVNGADATIPTAPSSPSTARPAPSPSSSSRRAEHTMADTWITDTGASTRFPVYTRANASDVLPGAGQPARRHAVVDPRRDGGLAGRQHPPGRVLRRGAGRRPQPDVRGSSTATST